MKKMIFMLTALLWMTVSANAMSYEQARQQALFLTDKMAYELNLSEEQYEAAFEINLDYLMSVNTVDDLYGVYWTHRNLDLSYVLLDWQYRAFCAANYFYRPLYWDAGYWHFGIYARYPHRDYFYFGRPYFWTVYRGGHSWHSNGGRSWYHGRDFGHRPAGPHDRHIGMRNGFQRGDYRNGFDHRPGRDTHHGSTVGSHRDNGGHQGGQHHGYNQGGYNNGHGNTHQPGNATTQGGNHATGNKDSKPAYGGSRTITPRNSGTTGSGTRQSSTRTTVTRGNTPASTRSTTTTRPSRTFTPSSNTTARPSTESRNSMGGSRNSGGSHSNFGGGSRSNGGGSHSGGFGGGNRGGGGGSHSGGGSRSGSFGGRR